MDITNEHVDKIRKIKDNFLSITKVPEENNWESKTNNKIWANMIIQVIVVGNASPGDSFKENEALNNETSYENLKPLKEEEIREKIHKTLFFVKARYVGSDAYCCPKVKALVKNFGVLKITPMGQWVYSKCYRNIKSEKMRIEYIKKNFSYLKDKGARDFLMEMGLIKNAIALDSRVKGILEKCGIDTKGRTYDEIETTVLEKICKPLGISGVQFDRLIFQNYREIEKMKFEHLTTFFLRTLVWCII